MGHPGHPAPLTPSDFMVLAVLLGVLILFLRGVQTALRRARAAIHQGLAAAGYQVVRLQYRWFSFGSGLGLPGRGQVTYRFVARDPTGKTRTGWARWGRVWVLDPDRLELRWDDESPTSI